MQKAVEEWEEYLRELNEGDRDRKEAKAWTEGFIAGLGKAGVLSEEDESRLEEWAHEFFIP